MTERKIMRLWTDEFGSYAEVLDENGGLTVYNIDFTGEHRNDPKWVSVEVSFADVDGKVQTNVRATKKEE